jgi:RimJ/RimL family protein N-acetyltransferase
MMIGTIVHQMNSSKLDINLVPATSILKEKKTAMIEIKLGTISDYVWTYMVINSNDFRKWCTSDYWNGFNISYKTELKKADINEDHVGIGLINGKRVAIFSDRRLFDGMKVIGVHLYILPRYRRYSFHLSKKMIEWVKSQCKDIEVLAAEIPEFNLPAIVLAKKLGFKLISWSDKILKKDGRKWKLYLYMLDFVKDRKIEGKYSYLYKGGSKNA